MNINMRNRCAISLKDIEQASFLLQEYNHLEEDAIGLLGEAIISMAIIAYGRVFCRNYGSTETDRNIPFESWFSHTKENMHLYQEVRDCGYSVKEIDEYHKKILELRSRVIAHSDSKMHQVSLVKSAAFVIVDKSEIDIRLLETLIDLSRIYLIDIGEIRAFGF